MFNGPNFPRTLDDDVFSIWLENGRLAKIGYKYLLIIWDEYDSLYKPVYAERRDDIGNYSAYKSSVGHESLVAAYDLYSESRVF